MRYGAFIRGINLGSQRRVSSGDLRSCFEQMGFPRATTFRTSGNVVFEAGQKSRSRISGEIEAGLTKALGFDVSAFLRSEEEMRAIAGHQPFPSKLVEASAGKLQVALLSGKPSQRLSAKVLALGTDDDRLAFRDRELFWLPSGGTRDSALDYREIEKLLGPTTRRTKGTLEEMVAKYFAKGPASRMKDRPA